MRFSTSTATTTPFPHPWPPPPHSDHPALTLHPHHELTLALPLSRESTPSTTDYRIPLRDHRNAELLRAPFKLLSCPTSAMQPTLAKNGSCGSTHGTEKNRQYGEVSAFTESAKRVRSFREGGGCEIMSNEYAGAFRDRALQSTKAL